MNALNAIVGKELLDFSRDRKTMLLTFLMTPAIMLLLIFGLGTFMQHKMKELNDKPLEIAIVGAQNAPNLVKWLAAHGVTAKTVADPDAAIRNQNEDVYIRIGDTFEEQWRKGEPAQVEVVNDSTRQDARIPSERVTTLLNAYAQQMGALRLLARGINPEVAAPVMVANKDLSTPEARRGRVMSFLPYLLILGGFLGGAALVIDMTAGERERQSLEPLLTTPAPRMQIVSGKVVAAMLIGIVSVTLTCLSFKLGAQLTPGIGKLMDISSLAVLKILLILLPLVALGSCLLTLIASGAKSVKEAQSYMSILMLLPMLPTIFLMVNPVKNALWQFAVPFLAQNQIILKVLRSEVVSPLEWLVYFVSALALVLLLWWLAVRRYSQEKLAIAA
ncbi:ABC transporter permease [Solilutibacter silvestris]|uniref:ABC-type Na+ efflux pump permease component n=1 Tax=Solilutibacter silvestris TaxID=1645665 RepID=A0A2K1Q130_9GAMM|nr:ABC transporter permease [Lysobacter silvestris]PNS08752.1 ABC-type Na+ efflux pump permease component [Lysobacter silvestris]